MTDLISEVKLDGKIFLVQKNLQGEVVREDELDGEACLKLLIAVLDDAGESPFLQRIFEASQE